MKMHLNQSYTHLIRHFCLIHYCFHYLHLMNLVALGCFCPQSQPHLNLHQMQMDLTFFTQSIYSLSPRNVNFLVLVKCCQAAMGTKMFECTHRFIGRFILSEHNRVHWASTSSLK
uniref:Uncharacterized protein n=1 Tax=Cacopsylla melanoneura TaxID=428564 RepID=A0A8D8YB39_9HEMI